MPCQGRKAAQVAGWTPLYSGGEVDGNPEPIRTLAAISCVGEHGNCDKYSPERLPWQEGGKSTQERDMTGSQEVARLAGMTMV